MTRYKCPECDHEFDAEVNYLGGPELYCEDCGTHPAVVCPACNELVDIVFNEVK